MKRAEYVVILALLVLLAAFLLYVGYSVRWTGFQAYVDSKNELVPPKKLWDWLQLLIVPIGLALAAYYLNNIQKESEIQKTAEQQREAALQNFITQMAELLMKDELRKSKRGDEARTIARARTLTVLRELDGRRKGFLIRFLIEAKLIQRTGRDFEEQFETPVINLAGADLRGADLSKLDFKEVILNGVDLTGANLRLSKLREAQRDGETKFSEPWDLMWQLLNREVGKDSLRGKKLRGVDFCGHSLRGFDLSGADLTGANLGQVELAGVKVDPHTRMERKWSNVHKIMWRRDISLEEMLKDKSDPQRLDGEDLSDAYLAACSLSEASLRGANFEKANLRYAGLERANLTGATLNFADCKGIRLAGAQLEGVRALMADFNEADLAGANLTAASLLFSHFKSAVFRKAILNKAHLDHAELQWTDLREANLQGADLRGAELEGAQLSLAIYDSSTRWPENFDPRAAGALTIEEKNMAEENKALIRRWFEEVWNKGREEAIDELFAEDGVAHGLGDVPGEPLRGASGFKPFFRNFRGAFPDVKVFVEDTIAEGDKVTARCTVRATHAGEGLGFAATQRPMEITGIAIVRVRDGKIVEAWNNFDFMGMFQQLQK